MFKDAYSQEPKDCNLVALLDAIRSVRYADKIHRARELFAAWKAVCPELDSKKSPEAGAYDAHKTTLPTFCVSGTAANRKEPLAHSGLLQVDLDHLDGTLEAVRAKVKADPHVAFGFVSPSGDGLKLGLRIDGARHAESFLAAEKYFLGTYGLKIDPAVKDRLRLCFVSHDPLAWMKADAVPLPLPEPPRKTTVIGGSTPKPLAFLKTARLILANRSKRCESQSASHKGSEPATPETIFHHHCLFDELSRKLREADLEAVFNLECDLIPVTQAMRARGILVDQAALRHVADTRRQEVEAAVEALRNSLGVPGLNPNKNEELLHAFRRNGIQLPGTSKEDFVDIDHPAVEFLQGCRSGKIIADVAAECLRRIGDDGRLHPEWDPFGTDTGRFSCRQPALQSLSRDPDLRRCFVAAPGKVFVRCDLAAADLRPLAFLAQDERLIEVFRQGDDIHRITAAALLGKPVEQVTSEDRKVSKLVIFAVVYGVAPKSLCTVAAVQHGKKWPVTYAHDLICRFFDLHLGLARYRDKLKAQATAATECRTIALRRRKLLPPGPEQEGYRFRCLLNMPAQGTVADSIKKSMVRLSRFFPAGAGIVANFHDELVLEVPETLSESFVIILETTMRLNLEGMIPGIPVKAEARISKSLGPDV